MSNTMNQTTKAVIIATSLSVGAALLISPFSTTQVKAAGLGGGEQYKIVTWMSQSPQQIEAQLNGLGAEGWKVRAAAGSQIILAK